MTREEECATALEPWLEELGIDAVLAIVDAYCLRQWHKARVAARTEAETRTAMCWLNRSTMLRAVME